MWLQYLSIVEPILRILSYVNNFLLFNYFFSTFPLVVPFWFFCAVTLLYSLVNWLSLVIARKCKFAPRKRGKKKLSTQRQSRNKERRIFVVLASDSCNLPAPQQNRLIDFAAGRTVSQISDFVAAGVAMI